MELKLVGENSIVWHDGGGAASSCMCGIRIVSKFTAHMTVECNYDTMATE